MNHNFNTVLLITNIIAQDIVSEESFCRKSIQLVGDVKVTSALSFALGGGVHGALLLSEIAEGMCQQYTIFLDTTKLPPRLERNQNSPVVPQCWFNWKSCENRSCKPFTIVQHKTLNHAKPNFQARARTQPPLSVIVELRSQPDCLGHEISSIFPIMCDSRAGNARILTKFLKNYTAQAQAGVVNILESKRRSLGFTIEQLWVTNIIIVTGSDVDTVKQMLQGHKDIQTVRLEEVVKIEPSQRKRRISKQAPPIFPPEWFWGQIEHNITAIHSAGVNGTGIVVGGIDSGVDYTHPALFENYRSEYGWYDPYFGDPVPNDSDYHGTHTMGTIVGLPPVGIAPGATWIACRSCLPTGCMETATIKCMQWMLCPTRPNGTDPDCSKKPRVVNNSWGSHEYFYNQRRTTYDGIIDCWRQAGIIPVFSAGNNGPYCSTHAYPGVSNQVLGVGALSDDGGFMHVHDESSRGPPDRYWNGTTKPDFIAPGFDIYSTFPDYGAGWLTGTSQAAPHVTGTIALMLQVNPTLSYDDVRNALIASARPLQVVINQSCGGVSENVYPNNQAGYGSINSFKAVFGRWP